MNINKKFQNFRGVCCTGLMAHFRTKNSEIIHDIFCIKQIGIILQPDPRSRSFQGFTDILVIILGQIPYLENPVL